MNNLSSYCGLVDAKIRASDKDLPVNVKSMVEILSIFVAFLENTNFNTVFFVNGFQNLFNNPKTNMVKSLSEFNHIGTNFFFVFLVPTT